MFKMYDTMYEMKLQINGAMFTPCFNGYVTKYLTQIWLAEQAHLQSWALFKFVQ